LATLFARPGLLEHSRRFPNEQTRRSAATSEETALKLRSIAEHFFSPHRLYLDAQLEAASTGA
jgi:hypothetical protein